LSTVDVAVRLSAMRRTPLRNVCVQMLGLLLALGMSLSVVQASDMAVNMAMSGDHMSVSGMGDCTSCKDGPGGARMMACDVACVMAMNATMPQFVVLLIQRAVDRPVSQPSAPSGWTASPNPHPPKPTSII
jgi:hypothetical protein